MLRPLLFLHRWLGIVVGLLMTIWCLSGFVMMYMDYPRLLPAEQLRGLAPLQLPTAAKLDHIALPPDLPLASATIEMMAGRPVLRVRPAMDSGQRIEQMRLMPGRFDLATGAAFDMVSARDLRRIAVGYGRFAGIDGPLSTIHPTAVDQWTVQAYRGNAPLVRADYGDPAGTQIYLSATSGEVVQQTRFAERFWGWLGAVPHWLYPTLLRQDGALWSQVVIWTSLTGCFLTATGLAIGIARLRRKRDGKTGSPFGGLWWWHHIFGLWFGALTLTWVASGLFSMNPWGFLDSDAGFAEREQLAGPANWGAFREAVAALPSLPEDIVRVEPAPLGGRMYITAVSRAGSIARFDRAGRPASLARPELVEALARVGRLARLDRLTAEDNYHYGHKTAAKLPVWRAALADDQRTRLYIDPDTGALIRAVDSNGRRFRWLMNGLHSLDLPGLRARPLWDLVVLPLLAMVTLVCATGTWMGIGKIRRDARRWQKRRRRRVAIAA